MKSPKREINKYLLSSLVALILINIFALIITYPKGQRWTLDREKSWFKTHQGRSALEVGDVITQVSGDSPGWARQSSSSAQGQFSSVRTVSDKCEKSVIKTLLPTKVGFLLDQSLGNCKKERLIDRFSASQHFFTIKIYQILPFTQAQLLTSMIFGGSQDTDPDIKHILEVIGMQHILAASGYNVGVVLSLGKSVFGRFCSRRQAALGIAFFIWSYVGVAGASPSLVRAALMASWGLLASYLFFQTHTGWRWALAGITMWGWDKTIISNLSFQLSMTASLGIILFSPLWSTPTSWLTQLELTPDGLDNLPLKATVGGWLQSLAALLKEQWLLTVAAQILTLPLLVHHFGEVNFLSFFSNPLLGWLTPALTLGGLGVIGVEVVASFLPWLRPFLGLFGVVIGLLTSLFLKLGGFLAQWPLLWQNLNMPWWLVWGWWLGVGLVARRLTRGRRLTREKATLRFYLP